MTTEWKEYVEDPRTVCKYGSKCYQKNPAHHEAFKHPPLKKRGNKLPERDQPHKKKHKEETKEEITKGEPSTAIPDPIDTSYEINKNNDPLSNLIPKDVSFFDSFADNNTLKDLFLVEMPVDFFKFYEFLNDGNGSVDKTLASVNLELIGPYDLLMGKLPVLEEKDLYLIHWRFFYDPPEFQAVIKKKGKSEYHIGYYRDSPDEKPVFVASNDSAKDCIITPMSDNIFGAIYLYLQNEKKSSPFVAVPCGKLMERIKQVSQQNEYSLEQYNIKKRWAKAVTKTLHGAGIVVPFNKKTDLGYRHLVETDANLKKLFAKLGAAKSQNEKDQILSELQPVITYANIAVDECDFGTGLEIGIDLFCSGLEVLENNALSCLTSVYTLLNRSAFIKIIQMHLKYRRKGPNMSLLSR